MIYLISKWIKFYPLFFFANTVDLEAIDEIIKQSPDLKFGKIFKIVEKLELGRSLKRQLPQSSNVQFFTHIKSLTKKVMKFGIAQQSNVIVVVRLVEAMAEIEKGVALGAIAMEVVLLELLVKL